jgi:hypothetical protein
MTIFLYLCAQNAQSLISSDSTSTEAECSEFCSFTRWTNYKTESRIPRLTINMDDGAVRRTMDKYAEFLSL